MKVADYSHELLSAYRRPFGCNGVTWVLSLAVPLTLIFVYFSLYISGDRRRQTILSQTKFHVASSSWRMESEDDVPVGRRYDLVVRSVKH